MKNQSLSSTEEKMKKKGGFSFGVGNNLDLKKPTIDKPKLSCEINVSVLDVDKAKLRFSLNQNIKSKDIRSIKKILIEDSIDEPKINLNFNIDKKKDKSSSSA
jgi:hypothetical protein